MFKRILLIGVILIASILVSSCGSNNGGSSKTKTDEAQTCAICGKTLTQESGHVKAHTEVGEVDVCNSCYAIGKAAGKCF